MQTKAHVHNSLSEESHWRQHNVCNGKARTVAQMAHLIVVSAMRNAIASSDFTFLLQYILQSPGLLHAQEYHRQAVVDQTTKHGDTSLRVYHQRWFAQLVIGLCCGEKFTFAPRFFVVKDTYLWPPAQSTSTKPPHRQKCCKQQWAIFFAKLTHGEAKCKGEQEALIWMLNNPPSSPLLPFSYPPLPGPYSSSPPPSPFFPP